MTLQEFKAWFEGFTEELRGVPSVKQWNRINNRIKEISITETTQTVFVDKYWNKQLYGPIEINSHPFYNNGLGIGGCATGSLDYAASEDKIGISNSEFPLVSNFSAVEAFKNFGCQEFREVQ